MLTNQALGRARDIHRNRIDIARLYDSCRSLLRRHVPTERQEIPQRPCTRIRRSHPQHRRPDTLRDLCVKPDLGLRRRARVRYASEQPPTGQDRRRRPKNIEDSAAVEFRTRITDSILDTLAYAA
jgi:hypothetical protein